MAGGFHYMFNHEYANKPYRFPEKIIDSCIALYKDGGLPDNFMKTFNFLEVDWLFCLSRALRRTSHRREEAMALIEDFASKYTDYLMSIDYETHEGFNDLHCLFGVLCALAELQNVLAGQIITEKPLKLVLDRRPFI